MWSGTVVVERSRTAEAPGRERPGAIPMLLTSVLS